MKNRNRNGKLEISTAPSTSEVPGTSLFTGAYPKQNQ